MTGGVLVPGTFDFFHKGHERLLKFVIEKYDGKKILIGIYMDAWLIRNNKKSAIYPEEERYEKVSTWIDSIYSTCSFDIHVHFLNNNEKYLFRHYELNAFICGKNYHLMKFFPKIQPNYQIIEIQKVRGISSREIREGSHPLCTSREIWIYSTVFSTDVVDADEKSRKRRTKNKRISNDISKITNVLEEKNIPHKKIANISYFEKGTHIVDKRTTIILHSEAKLPTYYVKNDLVCILEKGKDYDDDEILVEIIEQNYINRIESSVIHDKLSTFGNFRILLNKKRIEEGGYGSIYPASHKIYREKKYVAKVI